MFSITSGSNSLALGYNGLDPPGKWVILSKSYKDLRTEYVVYDYYTKILYSYFKFGKTWMDSGGSIVYMSRLIKAHNNYKKMLPRWLELYRYYIQFIGGKDTFTNIVMYYIEL